VGQQYRMECFTLTVNVAFLLCDPQKGVRHVEISFHFSEPTHARKPSPCIHSPTPIWAALRGAFNAHDATPGLPPTPRGSLYPTMRQARLALTGWKSKMW